MQNNIATFDKNKFTHSIDSLFDKLFEMDDHNSNSYPHNIFKRMKITTLLR